MERRYRLAGFAAVRRARLRDIALRRASCLALAGLLAACIPFGDPAEGEEQHAHEVPEKLPVIANLAVGGGVGGESEDAIAAVTARVMERLKATMQAEDLAAVRTFSFFPAIALTADPELIMRLLTMPEVESIERDHELRPLPWGDVPSGTDLLPPESTPSFELNLE